MNHFPRKIWLEEEGQDIAEYSVPSLPRAKSLFNGRATSAQRAVTWVWSGHVQPWRARSLPAPLACGSYHSGC
jgi:hypothetical protein